MHDTLSHEAPAAEEPPAGTQPTEVRPTVEAQPPAESTEPAPRRRRVPKPQIGRRLRVLAGVDERLLDRVPQERAWYTSLGGVVLGTATIAAISMYFAITQAMGASSWLAVFPVLVWFLFILNVDRWLVSSRLGEGWFRRVPVLAMRVLMAFFFGVIIAEPLVLRIFETAVIQHVADQRTEALAQLAGRLKVCNPVPGSQEPAAPADCKAVDTFNFDQSPIATQRELTARRTDAAELQKIVDADTGQLRGINELARRECVGDSGAGLTGQRGEGPNCRRLRTEADAFKRTRQLDANSAKLVNLRTQISELESASRASHAKFEAERETKIQARVAEERSHQGNIGLLERLGALHDLADSSGVLAVGIWAVRIFFILVDCMPILVKFVGGSTTYDKLVSAQLAVAERDLNHDIESEYAEREAVLRKRRAEIDLEILEHKAELNNRLHRAADRLSERV
ncbi:hypothetical protein Cme02nite_42630 [Catellatospora methionotrophica]|uniref:DUF4407 domain-containing protein n=1 Tax=Catellatospora methionotrophica TaxID=121620 RepID=A0A8J3PFQ5_9ACTN|nr:DUF4407 domain-containing protein [Catellatospora methionotrophica]GIG15931.1 hypothetical protein Cme02nite_42630 [Catellatospora methionotrophica]